MPKAKAVTPGLALVLRMDPCLWLQTLDLRLSDNWPTGTRYLNCTLLPGSCFEEWLQEKKLKDEACKQFHPEEQ